jgi:hypothetical protein
LHNGTIDLATDFEDGYGNSISPTYLPELQPGYVSPPPNFGSASDWAAAFSAWLQALELYAFP